MAPAFAPALAALALLCVAGYQQLVVIPGLRAQLAEVTAPQLLPPSRCTLPPGVRQQAIVVPAGAHFFDLYFDVAVESASGYSCAILDGSGSVRFTEHLPPPRPEAGGTINLLIGRSRLPAGDYTLVVSAESPGGGGNWPIPIQGGIPIGDSSGETFLYHALASGVSGHITLPFQHVIEVQAASALPFTGGYSASRAEGFRCKDLFSFSPPARSRREVNPGESFNTLATATVEGLNILNVVTADRVVARLASKYSKDTREYSATFAGSHFENLRIAGNPVEVEIAPERLKPSPRSEKIQFGTIAAAIDIPETRGSEVREDGAIYVPEFGRLYFAECVVTTCYQSISMFRVMLGCAIKGHLAAASASTNGEALPG